VRRKQRHQQRHQANKRKRCRANSPQPCGGLRERATILLQTTKHKIKGSLDEAQTAASSAKARAQKYGQCQTTNEEGPPKSIEETSRAVQQRTYHCEMQQSETRSARAHAAQRSSAWQAWTTWVCKISSGGHWGAATLRQSRECTLFHPVGCGGELNHVHIVTLMRCSMTLYKWGAWPMEAVKQQRSRNSFSVSTLAPRFARHHECSSKDDTKR
jgi:hypothetical protein